MQQWSGIFEEMGYMSFENSEDLETGRVPCKRDEAQSYLDFWKLPEASSALQQLFLLAI